MTRSHLYSRRSLHVENRRWKSGNRTGGSCRDPGQRREWKAAREEITRGHILHLRCQGSKVGSPSGLGERCQRTGVQRERANGFWLEQLVTLTEMGMATGKINLAGNEEGQSEV